MLVSGAGAGRLPQVWSARNERGANRIRAGVDGHPARVVAALRVGGVLPRAQDSPGTCEVCRLVADSVGRRSHTSCDPTLHFIHPAESGFRRQKERFTAEPLRQAT